MPRRVNPLAEKLIEKILSGKWLRTFSSDVETSPEVKALSEASDQVTTEKYLELTDLGLRPRRLAIHTSNKAQLVFTLPLTFFGDRFGLFSEVPSRASIEAASAAPAGTAATWIIASQVGKGIVTSALVRLDLATNDTVDPNVTLRVIVDDVDLLNIGLATILGAQAVAAGDVITFLKFDPTARRNVITARINAKFSRNMEIRLITAANTSFDVTSAALVGVEIRGPKA